MFHQGIQGIPYYLGIRSLADIATPVEVCVWLVDENQHGEDGHIEAKGLFLAIPGLRKAERRRPA